MDNEKIIAELVNYIQRGVRQTRDGSHLNSKEVEKILGENFSNALDKIVKQSGNIIEKSDIRKSVKEFDDNLKKLGVDAADRVEMVKSHRKDLEDARIRQIESIKNFMKNEAKARDKYNSLLKDEAKNNIARTLSNGRSDRIQRSGEALSEFGNSLSRIGGESGLLGKFGSAINICGKGVKAAANKIGVIIGVLETFGNVMRKINAAETHMIGFQKERENAEFQYSKQNLSFEQEIKKEQLNYQYELFKRNLEVESEIAKTARQLSADNYVKAVQIGIGSMTSGIMQTAYQSAAAAIDAGSASIILNLKASTERTKEENINRARGVQNQMIASNIAEEAKLAGVKISNTLEEIGQKKAYYEDENQGSTRLAQYLGSDNTNGGYVRGKAENDPSVGRKSNLDNIYAYNGKDYGLGDVAIGYWNSFYQGLVGADAMHERLLADANLSRSQFEWAQDLNKTQIHNANELKNLQASNESELHNIKLNYAQSEAEINIKAGQEVAKAYLELANKQLDAFGKFDKLATHTAIGVGITSREGIERYVDNMTQRMPDVFRKWGKSFEDVLKIQQSYGEATSRSINLSDTDLNKSLGLTMLTGDQSVTDELNADMQIFVMSVANSSQMFGEILDDSRQIGLDMRKMGKNLVRDMKLANRYEFKGGVKALAKMSEWATKVRFDMTNLPNLIDKYTNSLEDSIKNAASTQVLGGNFAMHMGDPLKNSFLAHMDSAQLAKNQNEALRGIGYFDSKEGKTKIGIADQMRLKQFSEVTGISMESLRAQITQQVQGEKVMNALTNENHQSFTNKQKELLQQQAFYDGNEWKVTLQDGTTKNINDVSQSDFADLLPHEEGMYNLTKEGVECLHQLVAKTDKVTGEENGQQMELFQGHVNEYYQTFDNILVNAVDNFRKQKEDYEYYTSLNLELMAKSYKGYCEVAQKGDEQIDEQTKNILSKADSIVTTLGEVNDMFITAKSKMEGDIAKIYQDAIQQAKDIKKDIDDKVNAIKEETKAPEPKKEFDWSTVANRTALGGVIGSPMGMPFIGLGVGAAVGLGEAAYDYYFKDGIVNTNGVGKKINDGAIAQNGKVTRIDNNDQVLAAKDGGPIDKMVSTFQSVMPRPMQYDSYVRENPYNGGRNQGGSDGKIEVSPIQININGNIQLSGSNGTIDITQQIANDPNFIRSLSQMISLEVEKKVRGGRVNSPLNRGLEF